MQSEEAVEQSQRSMKEEVKIRTEISEIRNCVE